MSAGIGCIFRIFTGQRFFVEYLAITAGNQTWVVIDASDQSVTISGNGVPWVRPETVVDRVLGDGGRALESNNGLWVAVFKRLVWPLASVDTVIIDESGIAMFLVWFTVGALDVCGRAGVAIGVDSELVLARRSRQRSLVGGEFARTAIDGPVVVAMVVDSTLSIEQQTIFARFQRQCSIRAEEELVTVVGMQVGLLSVWFRTLGNAGSIGKYS